MSTDLVVLPEGHDRRKYLGGSDAGAVLGLSNFRTPLDVYFSKTSAVPEELDPVKKKFLERRKRWEPVVVQMLREELDAEIVSTNLRYVDKEHGFMVSEIDAEAREDGEIINVEVKTVSPFAFGERFGWGETGTNDVPIDYEAQVMHGLGVTGRKKAILVAMVGLDSMQFYPITRDEKTLAIMRQRLLSFWNDHVLARVPPEPTELTDLNKLYRATKEGLVLDADTLPCALDALRLREINAQIDALQAEGERLEFQVKRAMKEAEALAVNGKKIVTWKDQGWSRIDYAALKADRVYSKYLREGKHRVFKTLKG